MPKRHDAVMKAALAEVLVAARMRRGLAQVDVARRMGVARTYVSKVENAKSEPDMSSLRRFAVALNTQTWNLVRCAEMRIERREKFVAKMKASFTPASEDPQAL